MSVKQSKKHYAVRIDHEMLIKCAKNRNLTKKSYRVLLYLFTFVDSNGYTVFSQKNIVEQIDMDKTYVSLALKNLKEEGIIDYLPYGQRIAIIETNEEEDEFDC